MAPERGPWPVSRVMQGERLLTLNSRSNLSTEPLQGSPKDVPSLNRK